MPSMVCGFESHAPELAHDGGGFEAKYFGQLSALEDDNFWFRARNRLIGSLLSRHGAGLGSLLEIGCGTGFVLSGIAERFPNVRLIGSEIFTNGLNFARERLPSASFMQMDARFIPFIDEFDVVGAFDVIEHIEEDEVVLAQLQKALKPGGLMLLSVPQHPWLWSETDTYARHVRRYRAADLRRKVVAASFDIVQSTSFVSLLLPLMVLSRILKRRRNAQFDPAAELKINGNLNRLLEKILNIEIAGIKAGLQLPWGGSRFVVARKPWNAPSGKSV